MGAAASTPAPASAPDTAMAGAVAAFSRGDYAAALPVFQDRAEAGDAEAQAWLGALHANGAGVEPSLPTAFAWYLRAAEQGHVQAATNVGAMLAMGQGVARDRLAGLGWLEKAAAAGDTMACYNVATLLAKGDGVPQDNPRAAALYRQAAETGHYPSQARLGHIYAVGLGVEKDRVAAFAWLSLAAQHGIGTALNALEARIEQMSADEKAKGAAMVQHWRTRHGAAAPAAHDPGPR